LPIFFTRKEVEDYLNTIGLPNALQDSLMIVRSYTIQFEVENNSKFPVTLLSSSHVFANCNPSLKWTPEDTVKNNLTLTASKHSIITDIMIYDLCCRLPDETDVEIELHYQTIYGYKTKNVHYKYNQGSETFFPIE
jgi:hypothetical protein